MSQHKLKRRDEGRYYFWIYGKLLDGFFAAYLDKVIKGFNREGNDVRTEVALLVDDADEHSTNTEVNNCV